MLRPETANILLRLKQSAMCYCAFTQTECETDKMTAVPNAIIVSVKYEQLHTILYIL